MANYQSNQNSSLLTRSDQPLIGVLVEEEGEELVRYFSEEPEADIVAADATRAALNLAGAWSDLDWDEIEEELNRIRHETPPSPPLDL